MRHPSSKEKTVVPDPHEDVWFTILCQPQSGEDWDCLVQELSLKTLDRFLPTPQTRKQVMKELELRGFDVVRDPAKTKSPSPLVTAHGPVKLFESTFKVTLEKHVRQDHALPASLSAWFEPADGKEPQASEIPGALRIALPRPPTPQAPRLPIGISESSDLRVPGDIAQTMRASRVHRMQLSSKDRATGGNIRVAVIDLGFYPHPFYKDHGYRITRQAAADTSHPEKDDYAHGTDVLANLFACAPDIDLYAVKSGLTRTLAFDKAMENDPAVVSTSLGDPISGLDLTGDQVGLWLRILTAISAGTIVVVAGGDGSPQWFPAMIPEVIAVGGVEITNTETISVWPNSSSFTSPLFPDRSVPDVYGVAADISLPTPSESASGNPGTWESMSGTSFAAPQVAGICALLLQKNPTLTQFEIKNRLFETAREVTGGPSGPAFTDDCSAGRATGPGLVDAFCAWQSVPEP
jgi:subtilisin family serine protease